ncbi:MAG TPA: hypothetical protein VL201_02320 [Patescibacteria group bacterium]|jgi:hypothetical protein|nr:hypothetical protein [Patescibacteria group bacterium]
MKKLFLSITLLLSGAFSFTTNDPFSDNFTSFNKELPASCINGFLQNLPAETKCTVSFDNTGNGFFTCPLTFAAYQALLKQYHPEKVATDGNTESEKTVASKEATNEAPE